MVFSEIKTGVEGIVKNYTKEKSISDTIVPHNTPLTSEVDPRKTSLTSEEANFLQSLQLEDSVSNDDEEEEENEKLTKLPSFRGAFKKLEKGPNRGALKKGFASDRRFARPMKDFKRSITLSCVYEIHTKLEEEIETREKRLSSLEKNFLEKLLNTPNVPVENITRAHDVLSKCKLYSTKDDDGDSDGNEENESKEQVDDVSEEILAEPKKERQQPETDRSERCNLRRQVWDLKYKVKEEKNPIDKLPNSLQNIDVDENPTDIVDQTPFSCGMLTSLCMDEETEKDYLLRDMASEKRDDATYFDYPILGIEETFSNPYVLSPPMMDVLRRRLPYAIREDNYWLKYSSDRDVSIEQNYRIPIYFQKN